MPLAQVQSAPVAQVQSVQVWSVPQMRQPLLSQVPLAAPGHGKKAPIALQGSPVLVVAGHVAPLPSQPTSMAAVHVAVSGLQT